MIFLEKKIYANEQQLIDSELCAIFSRKLLVLPQNQPRVAILHFKKVIFRVLEWVLRVHVA